MIVYNAMWWPGSVTFKKKLLEYYPVWNKDGKKNLQVIIVSGDNGEAMFKDQMDGVPYVAIPFQLDKTTDLGENIKKKIPCTGYPTPGVVNGTTGDVIDADVFGKVDQKNYD